MGTPPQVCSPRCSALWCPPQGPQRLPSRLLTGLGELGEAAQNSVRVLASPTCFRGHSSWRVMTSTSGHQRKHPLGPL